MRNTESYKYQSLQAWTSITKASYINKMAKFSTALVLVAAFASLNLATSSPHAESCHPSGVLHGEHGHCKAGKKFLQYSCSPPVTSHTHAVMTVNSFAKGGDGGGPSECDNRYHSDHEKVVALSTGWYRKGIRCGKYINIHANGRTVRAKVVDECDSVHGCDSDHSFQPPCGNNVVDASPAVWKALKIPESQGEYKITWSDA